MSPEQQSFCGRSMPGKLSYLIGLPRAGKSSYADIWAYEPKEKPRAIISGDAFRNALYGRSFQIEAEGTVFAMMDVAARALLARGHDIIIDETSTSEATLLRYYRIDINAQPIWIDTPMEVCIERAIVSGKPYLEGPIRRMALQLEKLKSDFEAVERRIKDYLISRREQDVAV